MAIYVTSKAYIKINTMINNSVNRQQSCLVTFCMCLNSFIVTVPESRCTYLLETGYSWLLLVCFIFYSTYRDKYMMNMFAFACNLFDKRK